MAIKLKTRDPKTTDFKKDDVVININNGSLFYKSNLGLHKLATTTSVSSTVTTAISNIPTIDPSEIVDPSPALTDEQVQDIVVAMFSNNIETNINATYDDAAGVINLEVPIQTEDDNGEIVTGNFYSIGLEDNNGTINATNNDLFLASGHEGSNGYTEVDKASITLKQNQPKIEVNGDLEVKSNTEDTTDGVGTGTLTVEGNTTVQRNLRADKICITGTNFLGETVEYFLIVNAYGGVSLEACPNNQCD